MFEAKASRQSPDTQKHTPGPWHCHGGAVYMRPFPDTSGCIANMDREEPETAPWERDANARLIASAPSLLEACQKALADLQDIYELADLPEQLRLKVVGSIGRLIGVCAKAEGRHV